MSGRERFASSKDVEIQTSRFFSDLVFILFLSGFMECFCTKDAFHIRIRKDCSEQVCVKESCVKVLWVKEWCATGVGVKVLCVQDMRGKVCVKESCVKELCGTEVCVHRCGVRTYCVLKCCKYKCCG